MKNTAEKKAIPGKGLKRTLFFPVLVLSIYIVLYLISPDKTFTAISKSLSILQAMAIPLVLIFVLMLILGIVLNPGKVAKLLGKGSGLRGMALASFTGIISAGPIYAWYPLLKDLKDRGAGESLIAVFLYNRSIKPFLLPLMISYFSPAYVIILTPFYVPGFFYCRNMCACSRFRKKARR